MPRVEYTASTGLVQRTGSGFALNQIETMNGSDLSIAQGTTFVELQTAHTASLPASASTGDICILAVSAGVAAILGTDNKAGGEVTFNAIGDGATCVYNGTQWVCQITNS